MSGDRIEKAKEALKLFIRSLPLGCRFSVLSFGSRYSLINDSQDENNFKLRYDERKRDLALNLISAFSADHGGTNIN